MNYITISFGRYGSYLFSFCNLLLEQYQNFLYAIGSIFAPLFAVLLTDYFLIKMRSSKDDNLLID